MSSWVGAGCVRCECQRLTCLICPLNCSRPERRSAQIVEYGTHLLEKGYLKRLGDELWTVLEQVAVAALDVGNWELAEVSGFGYRRKGKQTVNGADTHVQIHQLCLSRLDTRFPKSRRVATLRGMVYEGRGEFTRALHLYDELMAKADEADVVSTPVWNVLIFAVAKRV